MKIACAWLLLVITLSNWIGGFLYFEISYYIEIHHDMNAAEQAIAQQVQREIGTQSVVKVLNAQQVIPKGNIYGDFAFATQVDGDTVYYTLLADATDLQQVQQATEMPTSSNDAHSLLLKSLLQEFELTEPNYLSPSVLTPIQTTFAYTCLQGQEGTAILTPPPNAA